jgi:hypothetical protein
MQEGVEKYTQQIFVRILQGEMLFGELKYKREDNIKVDLRESEDGCIWLSW